METTNPSGSENQQGTTVQDAAGALLGLMDAAEAPDQGQVEAQSDNQDDDQVSEGSAEDWQDDEPQEESEAEPEEQEQEQTFSVTVSGEEKELTLSELKSLAQQGADYTKKTQQVAEQRKALEAESKAIEEARYLRDAYAERLQAMEQLLSAPEQSENLEYLKESDPIGYAVKVAELSQQKEQLYAVQAERQRIAEQQQAEQQQALRGYLAEQSAKLAQVLPEYSDPVKGEALRSELRSFAKDIGFSDEELSMVRDSRQVLALHKAMLYDKLQKAKPEVNKRVSEASKTIKSGNSVKPATSDQVKRQQQQLKQTGRVRDAAKLFENFF